MRPLCSTLTLFLISAGCAPGSDSAGEVAETAPPPTEAETADTGAETDSDSPTEPDTTDLLTLSGEITWHVDFSAEAEASGLSDCSYTRQYSATEDRSAPWLCPDCELMLRADVDMVQGEEDCYAQVSSSTPSAVERLGWKDGQWWRGSGENYPLSEQGTATAGSKSVEVLNDVDTVNYDDYELNFLVEGSLDLGTDSGDPMAGYTPPSSYSCGWPSAEALPYEGDWSIAEGELLPDGWFLDSCEQSVRLHDFAGRWMVIDVSAMDCPPCQDMARDEPAFAENMAQAGVDVAVITLLAPSLYATLDPMSTEQLQEWESTYDLHSPVLGDRGYGYAVVGSWADAALGGFGYPTWVVVDPNLKVVGGGVGYSSFAPIEELILGEG